MSITLTWLAVALMSPASPGAAEPQPEAWPPEILLVGPQASHAIISSGDLISRDPRIARVEGRRVVAVSDGETAIETAGSAVRVAVRGTARPPPVDFATVILPILTRRGCNAAACHGAALGQAGFKLSLFGNAPEEDYLAITHQFSGRRIDRADPASSLILLKPTRRLPHRGGRVLREDSESYRVLLDWAERGFPASDGGLAVERIEVRGSGRLVVRAWCSDGVARDVTQLAQFTSADDAIAAVDPEGAVTPVGPGETSIMVRYQGHVAAAQVSSPFPGETAGRLPVKDAVDRWVGRTLERLNLEPSGDCGDETFIRRAFLDLTGTLPTPVEVRGFLARPDRDALIDELIARPEFDAYWAYRLDGLFSVSSRRMGEKGAAEFHRWLRGRVRAPWADTARAVLTAGGLASETGFYRSANDPKDLAEELGRIFLGARWQCAQCHDHPFERFRQTDYFGMAAMFARVRRGEGEGIVHLDRGEITFPRTGKPALPVFPDGAPGEAGGDRRPKLAAWVTAQPGFGRALANRIWAHLMGRGLVHPADDFRSSNPPSHPELLEELARLQTIPEIVRTIARSASYQRAGPTARNRGDDRAYSHAFVKPLPAEVLLDAIARASGVADAWPNRPNGTRAIELGDLAAPSYALDVCGRNRPGFEGSLAQELHLLVGGEPDTGSIAAKLGGVEPLLVLGDRQLIEELYLRTLSRLPAERETERWLKEIASGPRGETAEDLLWALLNSWEFRTCH